MAYNLILTYLKDENDNFLVELAVASGAEVIITYNTKDFKNSQLIFNHKIITPENLIKELLWVQLH